MDGKKERVRRLINMNSISTFNLIGIFSTLTHGIKATNQKGTHFLQPCIYIGTVRANRREMNACSPGSEPVNNKILTFYLTNYGSLLHVLTKTN